MTVLDITEKEYFSNPDGYMSRSRLVAYMFEKDRFRREYLEGLKEDPTEAMARGTAVDELALLGGLQNTVIQPSFRGKPGGKQKFYEENKGRNIVTERVYEEALQIASLLTKNDLTSKILGEASIKQSVWTWTDENTGINCWARVDGVHNTGKLVWDLKVSNAKSPEEFVREIEKYKLHIQAAMYLDAVTANIGGNPRFAFVVAPNDGKTSPFIVELDSASLEIGGEEYRAGLVEYANDDFDGAVIPEWSKKINSVSLSKWYKPFTERSQDP